jgi:HD-GYP domain-containing protein (c-di-GMP phosphodiesterase class II)
MAAGGYEERLNKLLNIGTALSSERNLDRLLEMILDVAREFTGADAGTLYLVEEAQRHLRFEIVHNDTQGYRTGGTSGNPVVLDPVPLDRDGAPNLAHVAAYVAHTGELVNIPDVYEADGTLGLDFSGPRRYDETTGYRTRSMLCVPMRNHEDEIIGVLQLINGKDETGATGAFASEFMRPTESLASQAAVALTNAKLINDLNGLFESFIKTTAGAIERKSPYTGGHIRRVTDLTMMIARKIDELDRGPYADVRFSEDELEELRIAAWMHDIGKITTPVHVVDKATKLESIVDRIELVKARFDIVRQHRENQALRQKVEVLSGDRPDPAVLRQIDDELQEELGRLDGDLEFLVGINKGGEFMADEKIERLEAIARQTYETGDGPQPYLTEDEVYNLSIKKGTLNAEDRQKVEEHALVSIEMLRELPFPKKLARVPEFAGGHHEKLNGTGYPFGLGADQLSLQARVMAVADIFEALTARDRPYKPPMPLSKAVQILGFFVKDGELDSDIVDLFIKEGVYREYAEREMDPTQIDAVEI